MVGKVVIDGYTANLSQQFQPPLHAGEGRKCVGGDSYGYSNVVRRRCCGERVLDIVQALERPGWSGRGALPMPG